MLRSRSSLLLLMLIASLAMTRYPAQGQVPAPAEPTPAPIMPLMPVAPPPIVEPTAPAVAPVPPAAEPFAPAPVAPPPAVVPEPVPALPAGAMPAPAVQQPRPPAPPAKLATPRETLKTLYFSITAYDFKPEMVFDAIACLEQPAECPKKTSCAAKLAVQLDAILRELCIPIAGVPEVVAGDSVVVYEDDDFKFVIRRQDDGAWRFDRETVAAIPGMYRLVLMRHKESAVQNASMREDYMNPSAAMRRFLIDSITGDFYSAAQALDLRRLPLEQRSERGPILAQQLMFVMQRRGWIFLQEVPNNPESLPYTWHADQDGRIVLERVRGAEGKDAWQFSRNTVKNLENMYKAAQKLEPDPRYVQLGRVVPAVAATVITTGTQRPASVPPSLGSPRAVLQGFFRAMDEAEDDDRRLAEAVPFLNLDSIPSADRAAVGGKLASKLDSVLRKLEINLAAIPDSWNAPAQFLGKERNIRVEISRLKDGTWRFSSATVAQVPQFFDLLASQKQADQARTGHQESARDTMVSFLADCNRQRDERAAHCLDLAEVHPSVRDEAGRILAFKLKYVIDRIARVYPQEVPDEPEGPRFVFSSSEDGRIVIARKSDGTAKGKWFFTTETVDQIEPMFLAVLGDPPHPSLQGAALREPSLWDVPAIWLRLHLPEWAKQPVGELQLYQWLGLVAILVASWVMSKVSLTCLQVIGVWVLQRCGSALSATFVHAKLRPLTWVCTCWLFFQGPLWLDLPLPWLNTIMPARTFIMAGLMGCLGFQMIELLMAVYTNSELLRPHRSLSDMIAPVSMRFLKGGVVLLVLGYIVYHVGHADSLLQFFTGLGIAGFAASLAAQDILKSFFGTLLLIGERSFKLGDRIKVNGQEGVVEQVGFRSTRLRAPDGSLVTIPNSTITSASIDNQGSEVVRRQVLALSLNKDFPIGRIVALRERLHTWLNDFPDVEPDKTNVTIELNRERGVELLVTYSFREGQDVDAASVRQEITYVVLQMVQGIGPTPPLSKPDVRQAA